MSWFKDPRTTNNGAYDHFSDHEQAMIWIIKIFGSFEAYKKSLQRNRKFQATESGWISTPR